MPDRADDALRFAVLGPVRAWRADTPLVVGSPQQRVVLAMLLLRGGRPVGVDELLHAIWGEELPASAVRTLRSYVSRLRGSLDPAGGRPGPLVSVGGGYALEVSAECVDAGVIEGALGAAARARATGQLERAEHILAEALALPQGTPLAGLPGPFAASQRDRLTELLLNAGQQRLEAGLELGRHAEVVAELSELAARHPLRERLRELLMLALYRGGRQAEAIGVFLDAQRQLADELGVSPGPGLQSLYERILRADPALAALAATVTGCAQAAEPSADTTPPQAAAYLAARLLPRALTGFVERNEEWARLDQMCGPDAEPMARLAVVAGPAGSGKTSLVVRWAHAVADRFPDGQLFGDLRGFSTGGPADPSDVLHTFLRAMGVPEDGIPDGVAARSALYRDRVRGRRVLVVLDNVLRTDDVAAFLPDRGPAVTVVCSRHALEELIAREGVAFQPVGTFTTTAAHELLRLRLGDRRALEDPGASRRLVELCDHLPLALSIALARLAARPAWSVADLVGELEDERARLAALGVPCQLSVERELALTRRQLPAEAERLLPLLALHPGTEIDATAAAALLDRPLAAGRRALVALAALHLVNESSPGRYQAHDLVRLYCSQVLNEEVGEADRARAAARLADYYLAATAAACVLVFGDDGTPCRPLGAGPKDLPRFKDTRDAMVWWRSEASVIRALVDVCTDSGDHDRAWRLADNAAGYYVCTGLNGWLDCATAGLRAARRLADPAALARTHTSMGIVLGQLNRPDEALPYLERALKLHPEGDRHRVITVGMLAGIHLDLGRPELAGRCFATALEEARATGDPSLEAFVLLRACVADLRSAAPEEVLRRARRARHLMAGKPLSQQYLGAMLFEAAALDRLGRTEESETTWRRVIELSSYTGDEHLRGLAEAQFAAFLSRLGRVEEGSAHLDTAIALYHNRDDDRAAAALTHRFTEIGATGQIVAIEPT
ncbi:AfsR/SARP family transcriptional regulator [Streptantibioticus ferralitis]|uniref:BTAD domain-containing putative transcriptional regulator n=1 Tax=Streptantibioticus ferralitis TaxID=236510 RepID=A0ABT5YTY3_9ACTN|nr:BTAD domain-containing putative transcriptional regulator [Streptantibioticus ferralitis]MDF2255064.1 BTAD domain-containing putative transcriptional regulator [Streptantibioticus ferralitis]